ncbi:MAG: alpha/beta fold hydrolase [Cytophagales bacterium]|nr:alpha/beta fold hydrolase [Cytophagales bacterium]
MKVFYRKIGNLKGIPLCVLHGFLGSGDNWYGLAKGWSSLLPVYLLDARNHGRSFHHPIHDYESMAEDVIYLMDQEGWEEVYLLGHSMGGKTAMHVALNYPHRVKKLCIADMTPLSHKSHAGEVNHGLEALKELKKQPIQSRGEAEQFLAKTIQSIPMRQFLLKNLNRTDEGFKMRPNLDVLWSSRENLLKAIPFGNKTIETPSLFLRGNKSEYIKEPDIAWIQDKFHKVLIQSLSPAGHWLHAEQPQAFTQAILSFFLNP